MEPLVAERIARFRADLPLLTASQVVQKHVTFGDSYILSGDQFFSLKREIAENFQVHPNEVFLVGSAKLGFSIARKKRYRPFTDTSDLDIAVVSDRLFDAIWQEVFRYRMEVGYWPEEGKFKEYLFRGWIRPDKLPPAHSFRLGSDWWAFFRDLTKSGRYGLFKIAAGLYRSHFFLESYQSICVSECQAEETREP